MICLTLMSSAAFADVINVPADYATIQDAIDASANGDVIQIAAGVYYEHDLKPGLNNTSRTILGTLKSDGSPATTTDATITNCIE
tara:strand:+ start:168 stop:422 length:255 start_codon:yes stop_codon:yes gene_type:complete